MKIFMTSPPEMAVDPRFVYGGLFIQFKMYVIATAHNRFGKRECWALKTVKPVRYRCEIERFCGVLI